MTPAGPGGPPWPPWPSPSPRSSSPSVGPSPPDGPRRSTLATSRSRSRRPHHPPPVARRVVVGIGIGGRDRAQPRTDAARPAGAVHQARSVLGHGGGGGHRRRRVRGRRLVGRPPRPWTSWAPARRCRPRSPWRLTIGSQAVIDPRQQIYLLMPYWALLVADLGDRHGQGSGDPTAGLRGQSHRPDPLHLPAPDRPARARPGSGCSSYVRARLAAGERDAMAAHRTRRRPVCWAQPLWDQIAGERNLGAVARQP